MDVSGKTPFAFHEAKYHSCHVQNSEGRFIWTVVFWLVYSLFENEVQIKLS